MSRKTGWALGAVAAVVFVALFVAWFAVPRGGMQPVPELTPYIDPARVTEQAAMAEAAARAWVTYDSSEPTEQRVDRLLETFESTDGMQGRADSARRNWAKKHDAEVQVRVTGVDAVVPVGEAGSGWIFSVVLSWEGTYTVNGSSEVVTDRSEFWVYVPKSGDEKRAALIQER